MDNDILINQARQLYAALCSKLITTADSNANRLEGLLITAQCRYQRRLNRCVLCYRYRTHDCIRDPGKKVIPCKPIGSVDRPAAA